MDDFVAYKSPWRLVFAIIGSFSFVAGSIFIFIKIVNELDITNILWKLIVGILISLFGIIFFIIYLIVFLRRLIGESEILRINLDGVRWKRWSNQTIPWKEITNVTTYQYQLQKCIILHLRDGTLYPGHGVMGFLAGANRVITGGHISIVTLETNRTFSDTLSAIERFRSAAVKL